MNPYIRLLTTPLFIAERPNNIIGQSDTFQLKNMMNGATTKMKEVKNIRAVLNLDEENEIAIGKTIF